MKTTKCVSEIEGPWSDPPDGTMTGLIERCKKHWNVPANLLSDQIVATYLRQRIATDLMIEEATRRLTAGVVDDSELYDGELANALEAALKHR